MFKFVHYMFPKVCNALFKINTAYCHNLTRQSNNLYLPKFKLSVSQKFLTYIEVYCCGIIFCTKLTNSDFLCFKSQLKNYLLENDVNI